MRTIRKDDNDGYYIKQHNLDCLEAIHLAGERCDPDTFLWI